MWLFLAVLMILCGKEVFAQTAFPSLPFLVFSFSKKKNLLNKVNRF